jgi:hypothetical protein
MGIPQEIWDNITSYVSAVSARNASSMLGFSVSDSNKKSAAVWGAIFRDERWVYHFKNPPKLLGSHISDLYANGPLNKAVYIALILHPQEESTGINTEAFVESLQPHKILDGIIHFTNSRIKLSAPEIMSGDCAGWITLPNPENLFHINEYGRVASYCLFWDNTIRHQCKELGVDKIIGEKGNSSTLQDLVNICWVSLPGKGHIIIANSDLSDLEQKRLFSELLIASANERRILKGFYKR